MDLHTASGVLTPAAPFDFEQSLDFLGMFLPTQGEQTLAPRTLTKAVMIDSECRDPCCSTWEIASSRDATTRTLRSRSRYSVSQAASAAAGGRGEHNRFPTQ